MLELTKIQNILNTTPLFSGCSEETLAAIAEITRERDYIQGDVIYEAGDEARDMFVLVRGLVDFTTAKGGGGLLNVQSVMKNYMIFGWAAVVPEHPHRIGTAKCLDDSHLLSINGDALLSLLGQQPQSGFIVMKRLCSLIASTFIEKR